MITFKCNPQLFMGRTPINLRKRAFTYLQVNNNKKFKHNNRISKFKQHMQKTLKQLAIL